MTPATHPACLCGFEQRARLEQDDRFSGSGSVSANCDGKKGKQSELVQEGNQGGCQWVGSKTIVVHLKLNQQENIVRACKCRCRRPRHLEKRILYSFFVPGTPAICQVVEYHISSSSCGFRTSSSVGKNAIHGYIVDDAYFQGYALSSKLWYIL